jgi:hypothetical protein
MHEVRLESQVHTRLKLSEFKEQCPKMGSWMRPTARPQLGGRFSRDQVGQSPRCELPGFRIPFGMVPAEDCDFGSSVGVGELTVILISPANVGYFYWRIKRPVIWPI